MNRPVRPETADGRAIGGRGGAGSPGPQRVRLFESFRIRGFRFLWSADALSNWAGEMETLILGWYVLVETGSPFLLGLFGALRWGGTLVSPLYGVLADRMDRRWMVIGLRLIFGLQALVLMSLGLSGALSPWHVFVIAGIVGLIRMGEGVVRQSLIADVVPARMLLNASSLGRTTQDVARIAGAFAGAGLFSLLGFGPAYIGVAVFYLASVVFALGIRVHGSPPRPSRERALPALRRGIAYMMRRPMVKGVMALAFLVNLTAFPLVMGLLPVLARDVFGVDQNGLALLVATTAGGALVGSMAVAGLGRVARPERLMVAAIVVWYVLLLAIARVGTMGLVLPLLGLIGAATSAAMITGMVVLLGTTAREFRGRIMGVRMMAVYGLPIGLVLGGFLSERYGVQNAVAVFALAGIAGTVAAVLAWPSLVRGGAGTRGRDEARGPVD